MGEDVKPPDVRRMTRKRDRLESVFIVIRQFREREGLDLTQEEVGERMGVSNAYISDLERGVKYPSINTLIRIAKALDVRPGELLNVISDREDAVRAKLAGQVQPPAKQN